MLVVLTIFRRWKPSAVSCSAQYDSQIYIVPLITVLHSVCVLWLCQVQHRTGHEGPEGE